MSYYDIASGRVVVVAISVNKFMQQDSLLLTLRGNDRVNMTSVDWRDKEPLQCNVAATDLLINKQS